MVIYIVNKCADYDGHLMYKHNSLVGVYDNYDIAKYDVMQKLKKCSEVSFAAPLQMQLSETFRML